MSKAKENVNNKRKSLEIYQRMQSLSQKPTIGGLKLFQSESKVYISQQSSAKSKKEEEISTKEIGQKPSYNCKNINNEEEIEFKVVTKETRQTLNSNFSFHEDQDTLYAKTTTGERLPFKLFRPDDSQAGSNLLWEPDNAGENTNFALVERRFSENNLLKFFGSEKIENHNDVAWLFRSLEDEAIEHAFIVYDFEDRGYFVQHISTGVFNSALVDNRQIVGNIIEANPSSVTLVHNHPSGNLKASKADALVLSTLKLALKNTDVIVNDGIIINLRSGNYLVFNEMLLNDIHRQKGISEGLSPIQAYSFSKQVLVENFQPAKVRTSEEVAAYITSQKFGVSDKTEMLILNFQLSIVGKLILPNNGQENFIVQKVSKFGGACCVLFGNNITPELINFCNSRLEHSNITILDGILFKSQNAEKAWESFSEGKKMDIDVSKISEDSTYSYYNMVAPAQNSEIIGGKIKDIAKQIMQDPNCINKYDDNTKNIIQIYLNAQKSNKMEKQNDFNQMDYLKNQLKYLGFGESEKLHTALEDGIASTEKSFRIWTSSDKVQPGNKVEFGIKFSKSEQGGVFLNSYDAILTNSKGETIEQNFRVSREDSFTAKEAINLLEGRAVKIEFDNPKTNEREKAFVQLNTANGKNQYGNYNFQTFYKNYGVDTDKIVEQSNLIFDKPEYRDSTIKLLEKGNIVKVKFEHNDNIIDGKAVLNPQYKQLKLYDQDMNRINTNKPVHTADIAANEKKNVREQSLTRGL